MRNFAAALLVSATLLPSAARAQMDTREGIALQNQILELRRDMQQLQDQLANGGGAPAGGYRPSPRGNGGGGGSSDLTAQLLDRVQTLEDQVRTLRGQVDQLQNQTQRQQADLSKQLGDLSFRLQQSGGRGAPAVGAPPQASYSPPPAAGYGAPDGDATPDDPYGAPPARSMSPQPGNLSLAPGAVPVPPPAAPVRRTPELALQEGNAALARRDYPAAETAAREVLSGGRGPRAYDAQFLLAQAQAGERNYQGAAIAYDDTYNRNHGGSRAQDSLLGLANALLNLGDKGAACGALGKLRSEFPSARADVREASGSLRARAGCG